MLLAFRVYFKSELEQQENDFSFHNSIQFCSQDGMKVHSPDVKLKAVLHVYITFFAVLVALGWDHSGLNYRWLNRVNSSM